MVSLKRAKHLLRPHELIFSTKEIYFAFYSTYMMLWYYSFFLSLLLRWKFQNKKKHKINAIQSSVYFLCHAFIISFANFKPLLIQHNWENNSFHKAFMNNEYWIAWGIFLLVFQTNLLTSVRFLHICSKQCRTFLKKYAFDSIFRWMIKLGFVFLFR